MTKTFCRIFCFRGEKPKTCDRPNIKNIVQFISYFLTFIDVIKREKQGPNEVYR